jgi:hypothetical protein
MPAKELLPLPLMSGSPTRPIFLPQERGGEAQPDRIRVRSGHLTGRSQERERIPSEKHSNDHRRPRPIEDNEVLPTKR